MSITRAQLRTRAMQRADLAGSNLRWDTQAGGEVDVLGGDVLDREWRRILTHVPLYRYASVTINSDSTGRYAQSGLTTGSGDTLGRLFQILSMVVSTVPYQRVEYREWTQGEALNLNARVYWPEGSNIVALPIIQSQAATFTFSHIPQRLDLLTGDGVAITFPDGYEEVPTLEWAAAILDKGAAESDSAMVLRAQAEAKRADMLQDLARLTAYKPLQMAYVDYATDWAGM